jgi:hypothetical protein
MTICKITEYISNSLEIFLDVLERAFLEINYKLL